MEDFIKLTVSKDIIALVLSKHLGTNFAQCQKCDSIKSDSRELITTLCAIIDGFSGSDDDASLDLWDGLLSEMIEANCPEECLKDFKLLEKWLAENESGILWGLSNKCEEYILIASRDVILKTDKDCLCFLSSPE